MIIPSRFYHNDTSYRNLTPNPHQGNIGCGFMFKPDASFSDSLRFEHYGALYLLSGRGLYEDEYGRCFPGNLSFIPDFPLPFFNNPFIFWTV